MFSNKVDNVIEVTTATKQINNISVENLPNR